MARGQWESRWLKDGRKGEDAGWVDDGGGMKTCGEGSASQVASETNGF